MGLILRLTNCRTLHKGQLLKEDLFIRDGKIIHFVKIFYEEKRRPDVTIDCGGNIVSPGFIDIQINGGFGYDFSHHSGKISEAVSEVSRRLLAFGVTGFCPTLVTSPPNVYKDALRAVKKSRGGKHGAAVLGLHLEGPFIALEKRGAHNPKYVRKLLHGVQDVYQVYGEDYSAVAIVTLAPELDPEGKVIRYLTEKGVVVSLGHSVATLEQGQKAAKQGATLTTHLFNAMLPFHHRDPGLVGLVTSASAERPIWYGLISDGVHTHPETLRVAHRLNPQNLVLVTDAIAAMGLSSGRHFIGDMPVVIDGPMALIAGTQTLCGSIGTMDFCVRQFWEASGCSIPEALMAASLHPAQALGLQTKGSLEVGCDADFVVLDNNLNVLSTWIAGEKVWTKDQ